jgi:hypothetical protein
MSTIKVSAIQDLSGGQDVNVPNAAKAWVTFNGTGTPAIIEDFNVTSITDIETGVYFINFENALEDANYAVSGTSCADNGQTEIRMIGFDLNAASDATKVRVRVCNVTGARNDQQRNSIVVFR